MLKNLELGRELREVESVNIQGGQNGGKVKRRLKIKFELEYEKSAEISSDTTNVAACDSIR